MADVLAPCQIFSWKSTTCCPRPSSPLLSSLRQGFCALTGASAMPAQLVVKGSQMTMPHHQQWCGECSRAAELSQFFLNADSTKAGDQCQQISCHIRPRGKKLLVCLRSIPRKSQVCQHTKLGHVNRAGGRVGEEAHEGQNVAGATSSKPAEIGCSASPTLATAIVTDHGMGWKCFPSSTARKEDAQSPRLSSTSKQSPSDTFESVFKMREV